MRQVLAGIWMLLCTGNALCQMVQYAPDTRWQEDRRAFLGFVNPEKQAVTVMLAGFDEAGAPVGERAVDLPGYGRFEAGSATLFEDGMPAWVRVASPTPVVGYVRYEDPSGLGSAMVQLSPATTDRLWVSQPDLLDGSFPTRTALANVGDTPGTISLDPVVLDEETETARKRESIFEIPDFGEPGQQIDFAYSELFKNEERLLWDSVKSEGAAHLAGVQQFSGEGTVMASLALPRTPYRELLMAPMLPLRDGNWNKIVLVNVYETSLRVKLTAYYEYSLSREIDLELAAFEKRILDINFSTQLDLPANPQWIKIVPYEGGLIGYQVFGDDQSRSLDVSQASVYPSGTSILPYTPTSGWYETTIGIVNLNEVNSHAYVVGFDDSGKIVAIKTNIFLGPGEKNAWTARELFGSKANSVTWARASTQSGNLMAYSVVRDRGSADISAFQGVTSDTHRGDLFVADFEHLREGTLKMQDWGPHIFSLPFRNNGRPPDFGNYLGFNPVPGTHFAEAAFEGETGYFFLGYDPLYSTITTFQLDREPDSTSYLSPLIEVPTYGEYYLYYYLRIFNPQYATPDSRFGMVWREEGSNQWHWLGVDGILLLDPPVEVRDCYEILRYRNDLATISAWIPQQTKLPDSLRGKRIQVGHYYHFVPDPESVNAPTIFIDNVHVTAKPIPDAFDFGLRGSGTFIEE